MTFHRHSRKPDENHNLVRDVMRDEWGGHALQYTDKSGKVITTHHWQAIRNGISVLAFDRHEVGGMCEDWGLWVGLEFMPLEIKKVGKRDNLTPSERAYAGRVNLRIIATREEFIELVDSYIKEMIL